MTMPQTPNGGLQFPRGARYHGYELDGSTVVNSNLKRGAVLQALAGIAVGSALITSAAMSIGSTNYAAGAAIPDDAFAFGRPTSGYNTPFCVVSEDTSQGELDQINELEGVTANLRKGGKFKAITSGLTRALVKHGTALTKGVTLLVPTNDAFHLTPFLANGLFSQSLAASDSISNSVATEQSYTGAGSSVTIPANSLKVGDVIRGTLQVVVSAAASTDTHTVKVKIGTNIVAVAGVPDAVTGDVVVIHYTIVVRTIGASGTAVSCSLSFAGTTGAAAGAADIPTGSALASFTLDTTAAVTIQVTTTWSATSATCTSNIEIHNVYIDSLGSSLAAKPFAVAMETGTINDSTNGEALARVLIVQPPF